MHVFWKALVPVLIGAVVSCCVAVLPGCGKTVNVNVGVFEGETTGTIIGKRWRFDNGNVYILVVQGEKLNSPIEYLVVEEAKFQVAVVGQRASWLGAVLKELSEMTAPALVYPTAPTPTKEEVKK
jgi:hypothetical protein